MSTTIFRILIAAVLSGSVLTVNAQEECTSEDKKAEKYYEKGINKKKYDQNERIEYFMKALDRDPDHAKANWELAYMRIRKNMRRGMPFDKAQSRLETAIASCPSIHASAYFFLAEIHMKNGEYAEAAERYEEFINFDYEGEEKYERKHDEYFDRARRKIKEARFFRDEYDDPKPFDPQIVKPVSTDDNDEYLPVISPDNELMLFTRRTEKKHNPRGSYVESQRVDYIERFSSAPLKNGKVQSKGAPLPPPFNQNENENYGGAAITPDNREIIMTICTPQDNYINCDLYSIKKKYGRNPRTKKEEWYWSVPDNLGPNINTSDGWEAQPTLSRDGKMLIFAALREDETRGIDLYISNKMPDGSWSKARSMGEPINTDFHEKTPFFHADSRTLYFASQGHYNFGGYDVYFSKYQGEGSWSEPQNLGHPINTDEDEHGYVVSTDGKKVYYASKTHNGKPQKHINIFSFTLYEEARPEKVLVVKGNVKNKNGEIPKDAEVSVRNSETNEEETFKVDTNDGKYTALVTLDKKTEFTLNVKGKGLAFNSMKIGPGDTAQTFLDRDIETEKAEKGGNYEIPDINFATNRAALKVESQATLDAFAEYLHENADLRISIEGHTDNVGSASDNMTLSTERAYSVMEYLQEAGIPANRLEFKGHGETKPVADNNTEEGRAKNRRTEFVILGN